MRLSRETRVAYLVMAACVTVRLVGSTISNLWPEKMPGTPFDLWNIASFACYAVFVLAWLRLLRRRSIDRETSACLTCAALLLLLLAGLAALKHEISWWEAFDRYLWYGYYISTVFAPTLLFFGVLHIGMRSGERLDRRWYALLLVALALVLLVMTNDLHMLVFRFPGGPGSDPALWRERDAVRGPLALVPWAWLFCLSTAGIVVALTRCLRSGARRRWWVLLMPLVLGLTYVVVYYRLSDQTRGIMQFRDVTIVLIVVFMECLVRLGLLPANEGYGELWEASSLRGALMADDGSVAYAAAGAPQVTPQQVRTALELPQRLLDDDQLLVACRVTGGMAYWVRDLSRMHLLKAQLDEQGDVLREERAMLSAANELAREREAVTQRNLLYDELTARVAPHLARLEGLLASLPEDEEGFVRTMRHAAVEATYVKRCANLMLAGEGDTVDARDLALALQELHEAFAHAGADSAPPWQGTGRLSLTEALAICEAYQETAGRLLVRAEGGDAP